MVRNVSALNDTIRPFILWMVMTFGLVQKLSQGILNQVAGFVIRNKIDLSVLSDTTVSVLILLLVLVDLMNCKGSHH